MIKWMKDIKWGRVFLVAGIFTVISLLVRQLEMMVMFPYYQSEVYRSVWNKLLLPTVGPISFEFLVNYLIATFLTGISLCIIYYYLKSYLPKKKWERTFFFADVLVATSFVFFTIPVYILFNVPLALLGSWFLTTFISVISASILIVHLLPEK